MNEAVMSIADDDERRFELWISRLEESFKNYLAASGEQRVDREALINVIRQTVQSDLSSYPRWIAEHKHLKLGKLTSSSNDLKVFLRHVTFPGVLQGYHVLHEELIAAVQGLSTATDSAGLGIQPLSSKTASDEGALREFFQGMASGNEDGLMGLCKLADINHRIHRAAEHDSLQVSTWLDNEQLRSQVSERSLVERQQRLLCLTGQDEHKAVEEAVGGLKVELDLLNEELLRAEDEEEKARRAYEAAIARKKKSLDRVAGMETFLESVHSQRDLLKKVHTLCLELDAYNQASASKRVELFQGVTSYLGDIRSNVMEQRLVAEIPDLFSNLVSVFTTTNASGQSKSTSLFCAAKVGQETIRLWNQLNADTLYPALREKLDEFGADLQQILGTMSLPSPTDAESNGVFRADDSTVVLYFDHLHHDTPEEHVEAQSRVSTCMSMLRQRLSLGEGAETSSSSAETASKKARRRRTMHIVNCNDVLSPPTWCLPLSHSPQYLSHLWRLAEEALQGDLYVPLEFDTEWESEDPYRSDSDEEESGRRHASHIHKTMALPTKVAQTVGAEKAKLFSSALSPAECDMSLAKLLRRQEAKEQARLSSRRRRDQDQSASSRRRDRNKRPITSVVASAASNRVKTPYGCGVLVSTAAARADGIVEVKLDFGAVGFFHSACVEPLPDVNDERTSSSNNRQSSSRSRSSEGGSGWTADMRFMHTDLRLHRILQRMVSRVKVQRILGDLIGLNHANLSLWMHGRTSVGLNKTTEKAISKWLATYDRKLLRQLLLDTDNDEYSPDNANSFLARLKEIKLKKDGEGGSVASTEDSDSDNSLTVSARRYGNDGNSSSDFDSDAERVKALRYSEDKVSRKFNGGGGSETPRTSSQRPSAVSKVVSSTKPLFPIEASNTPAQRNNSDSRSKSGNPDRHAVAKYSAEGEVLRNLMQSVMRTLRISQGGIANDYQKKYRYETSQGGVSAWFHYRGVPTTFDRMNRCAVLWVEDYRAHLSPEEQRSFDDLCARMNASSDDNKQSGEEGDSMESNGSRRKAQNIASDAVLELEGPAGKERDGEDVQLLCALEASTARHDHLFSAVESVQEEEKEEMQVSSPVHSVHSTDDSLKSCGHDQKASLPGLPPSAGSSSVAESKEVVSGQQTTSMETEEVSAQVTGLWDAQQAPAVESNPTAPDNTEVRTISDLHKAVVHEMQRRNVSQSATVVEAELSKVGMGQPALSKFLSIATVTNNQKGSRFCQLMLKWLEFSRQKETVARPALSNKSAAKAGSAASELATEDSSAASSSSSQGVEIAPQPVKEERDSLDSESEVVDTSEPEEQELSIGERKLSRQKPDKPFDPHTCGICQKRLSEFANHKSFHMHIAWCYRRKQGVEPPPEYRMKSHANNVSQQQVSDDSGKRKAIEEDQDDASDNESSFKRQRTSLASSEIRQVDAPRSSRGRDELLSDSIVIEPDRITLGQHSDLCDVCKEMGELIKCTSCPCAYHTKCIDTSRAVDGSKWHCEKCVESGADKARVMPEEQKNSPSVENVWILVYSASLRRWRKAIVVTKHPTKFGVVLAKWWRSDNRGGKTVWLDISGTTILIAEGEVAASAYSRNKMQQLSAESHKQLGVQFQDQDINAKFKSQRASNLMSMDGSSGGAVPPGHQAAAAGLGGVGALKDGDEDKAPNMSGNGMSDTYISSNSLKAALCASGTACRAVDIAMCSNNTNVFACTRPPGHHAGRYGCTGGCLSTGFCLLNNAAIAAIYSRVRWGVERVAVIDIDVHFGNGTAELLRGDPNAFFASVHMIYGLENDGGPETEAPHKKVNAGFYPSLMGQTEVTDTYVSVGVYPEGESKSRSKVVKRRAVQESDSSSSDDEETEDGDAASLEESPSGVEEMDVAVDTAAVVAKVDAAEERRKKKAETVNEATSAAKHQIFRGSDGFLKALREVIIPQMVRFDPQLLIISAGFDGYVSDPIGGQLSLSLDDYTAATKMLTAAMDGINRSRGASSSQPSGRVVSLLEGGYDTSPFTLGLAKCVDAHVLALQES